MNYKGIWVELEVVGGGAKSDGSMLAWGRRGGVDKGACISVGSVVVES